MKVKNIIITFAIMASLVVIVLIADRRYMVAKWDGIKEVLVRFDPELEAREARVIRYSNETTEQIDRTIQHYEKHLFAGIQLYSLSGELFEENDEMVLWARGSGQRSIFRTDYEYWLYVFLLRSRPRTACGFTPGREPNPRMTTYWQLSR